MKEKGILHIKITAYHPNLNELVKRANWDLKNFLQKFMENKNNWTLWIIKAEFTLNNWAHWDQKLSLNELLTSINKKVQQEFNNWLNTRLEQ